MNCCRGTIICFKQFSTGWLFQLKLNVILLCTRLNLENVGYNIITCILYRYLRWGCPRRDGGYYKVQDITGIIVIYLQIIIQTFAKTYFFFVFGQKYASPLTLCYILFFSSGLISIRNKNFINLQTILYILVYIMSYDI